MVQVWRVIHCGIGMLFSVGVSQGGFSRGYRPLFPPFPVQVWVYLPQEIREFFFPLSHTVCHWLKLRPVAHHTWIKCGKKGGSLNFQSSSIELRCESMWRIISTLNHLHEPIPQHRMHINSSGGVQTHAGYFFVFHLGCLTSEVLAFFTAFPHISDHNASSPQLQF